jgi:peptidyl-prolyl cis-trans isomerase A (cyclophilin A)
MLRTTSLITAWMIAAMGCGGSEEGSVKVDQEALMDPSSAAMNQQAPEKFDVEFKSSKGDFVLSVRRDLAPIGVDRFYNLVTAGFYSECRFFRVMPNFMAQFGFHGDPEVTAVWFDATIEDDPPKESNTRGTITFATRGPGTRTTQLFINFQDNSYLDNQGFTPFGQVTSGMDQVVDSIYSGYGEKPNQTQIGTKGNHYLKKIFPDLDYIIHARVID